MAILAKAPIADRAKVIVWAHTTHLMMQHRSPLPDGAANMGQIIQSNLGDRYFNIAGLFGAGASSGMDAQTRLGSLDVGTPPLDSVEHDLWLRQEDAALIDMRDAA